MKKLITASVASLGVLASAATLAGGPVMPPPASPFPEWYIGAGPSWHSVNRLNIPGKSVEFDTGWHALVGVNATDNLGAEVAYTDLGDYTVRDADEGDEGGAQFRYWNVSAYGLFRYTIVGPLKFFAKLGMGFQEITTRDLNPDGDGGGPSPLVQSFTLIYGAGLGLRFGQFAVRAMYTRNHIVGLLYSGAGGDDGPITFNSDSVDLSGIWYFNS